MDERLRRVLRERVQEYLEAVERMLDAGGAPAGWAILRDRLRPLLTGWQALLATHASGETGRCRHCDRMRWRRRVPCSVWRTAHAYLVAGVEWRGGDSE